MSEPISENMSRTRTQELVIASLAGRKRAELLFRCYGMISIAFGLIALVVLFVSIVSKGYSAFYCTNIAVDVHFDPERFKTDNALDKVASLAEVDFNALWKAGLGELFPEVTGRTQKRSLHAMLSNSAGGRLRELVSARPALIGRTERVWLPVDDNVDMLFKGHISETGLEASERLKDQSAWLGKLEAEGRVKQVFNTAFFTKGDSREPESAGIWGAVAGSALTLFVTIALSLPIGIAAAIYLEEFAPSNRWTDLIEVNINNLAAVPSIVFGLLGLAVFINLFGFPRSSPLVGGLVLTLMTLPVIIIAGRSALKSVPPSVREAALGIGASPTQMVFHHVLPLAMPGMLTGAIIGTARALGESAPLLMIGMVAFIVDVPASFTDPSTVLPVQIYLWADSPERAFTERTSAAILILLAFLIFMNGSAVYLRKRFERRW